MIPSIPSRIKLSAGTLSSIRSDVSFNNSNGVSFGLNTNGIITGTVKTDYQASGNYLTTARASNDGIGLNTAQTNVTWTVNSSGISLNAGGYNGTGFTSTTTAGTAIVGTNNTAGLSVGVPAFLTTARASNDGVGLNTAQTNVTWTVNSSGISLNAGGYNGTGFTSTTTAGTAIVGTNNTAGLSVGVPAFLTTAMASNAATISNIKVSAGTLSANRSDLTFSNANGVTFGLETNGVITGSVAGAAALTNIKVSAGTLSNLLSDITFSNSNGVSFGLNGSTMTASIATMLTAINVSAGTTSNNLTAFTLSNSNGNFFGLNGSVITAAQQTLSYYQNAPLWGAAGTIQNVGSTSYVFPFQVPNNISASYLRLQLSLSLNSTSFGTTANTTFSAQQLSTWNAVIYTVGTGASSRSLQYLTSGSAGLTAIWSLQANANGSQYTVSYQATYPSEGASTNALSTTTGLTNASFQISTGVLANFTGIRYLDIPFAGSLSPGAYWMAIGMSSTTSTQGAAGFSNAGFSVSSIYMTNPNQTYGLLGAVRNASNQMELGLGSFTTNAIGTTASLDYSNISSQASNLKPRFELIRQA